MAKESNSIYFYSKLLTKNHIIMKELISNGLTIEQLEERMEFTTFGLDLTPDEIAAAHEAGYTDDQLFGPKQDSHCENTGNVNVGDVKK